MIIDQKNDKWSDDKLVDCGERIAEKKQNNNRNLIKKNQYKNQYIF